MNLQVLIDSIVRQTTVLIAQLATARGVRAPLAHVASQVFADLAEELNRQGVSRKVSADMFGLALRTYLRKIQRLSEGSTDNGRSLWQAVLSHLSKGSIMTRAEILQRFRYDDSELVSGVLHDLTESGLVFRTGSGAQTTYRAASEEELGKLGETGSESGLDELVWAMIYREGPLSKGELERRMRGASLDATLERLVTQGRVHEKTEDQVTHYHTDELVVPRHAPVGWEAAVFDHFQAMVKTIGARLAVAPHQPKNEHIGGSTYSFDVWEGHPFRHEALAQLARFREQTSELRSKIRKYNEDHGVPERHSTVTVYGGQCVVNSFEEQDNEDI